MRSVVTRLFGGGNFQAFLTIVIVFALALAGVVIHFVGPSALPAFLGVLLPGVPWLLGVTAWSRADADGVRWRYYRPRSYSWAEIEQVEFGAVSRAGGARRSLGGHVREPGLGRARSPVSHTGAGDNR